MRIRIFQAWWSGLALIGLLASGAAAQQPRATSPNPATPNHDHAVEAYKYDFGGFRHVDRLAGAIRTEANALAWEMHNYHRGRPGFKDIYREVKDMYATSGYVLDLVKANGSQERIRKAVVDLDDQIHHLQGDFLEWKQNSGSRHGLDDLIQHMNLIDGEVEHLMEDVGARRTSDDDHSGAAPPATGSSGPPSNRTPSQNPPSTDGNQGTVSGRPISQKFTR